MADMSSLVLESLSVSGILLGKTVGGNRLMAQRFRSESASLAELELRGQMTGRWVMSSVQMSFTAMPALVYLAAGHWTTTASLGTVVAFTTLQARLVFPITSLLGVTADLRASLALFERIFEYLDLDLDVKEGRRQLDRSRGHLSFDNVCFRYAEDGTRTLERITFSAAAGTKTAIVGATGAGKTTIAYLACRLYDPTGGTVTVDGIDIRALTFDSLSRTVGFVSQDTFLFHASVRDNLSIAKPDATDAEIEAATRAAQIHEFIEALPRGYHTVVGERGFRFSGGERQRLAIARALLRNPPILVLDEATSALDAQTERALQRAITRVSEGRTIIAIAHRLSTVSDADQILVLEAGRIVECGSHTELVARGERYASMHRRGVALPADRVSSSDAEMRVREPDRLPAAATE